MVTLSPDYDQRVYDVNVQGTKNIIDKCVGHNAKKLVYVSSTSAKAERELGYRVRPFDETIKDTVIWLQKEGKLQA